MSPRPTLFPYTTLFRSSFACTTNACRRLTRRRRASACGCNMRPPNLSDTLGGEHREDLFADEETFFGTFGDRKSTRLNSSHVAISYAVFCLKNKNSC